MNQEAWPTPADDGAPRPSREPLPRVEDLPIAEQGYDQQSVKAAFDSFYRHAAQLDASLRTLEAVDSFHRQAGALRADLRALRAAGWTQQPWPTTATYGYGARSVREGISPAVWRIAGEAAFLIAVAVAVGVAQLRWWLIVAVMALAWLLVGLIEWVASRDVAVARPAPVPVHPVVEAGPAERDDEGESLGWTAFEEAQEPSDAMTMIGGAPVAESETPAPEATAEEEPGTEAVAEPEAPVSVSPPREEPGSADEAEQPRRHWWSRRGADETDEVEPVRSEAPRHVRVLPPEEVRSAVDPWEEGFDEATVQPDETDGEPDEETGEHERPLAADLEEPARRRFRRR